MFGDTVLWLLQSHHMSANNQLKEKVLVTGVFDILHEEHRTFLKNAKKLGYLMVGIESDTRVKILKGDNRPVNNQAIRIENLKALNIADEVFLLPDNFSSPDDHRQLLFTLKPSILAVSSHSPNIDKKARLMQEIGGRVEVVHQHNPAVSTTKIIEARSKNLNVAA